MKKFVSLYVHIPFCALKCKYCDFLSFDGESYGTMLRYVDALCQEIKLYAPIADDYVVRSVFIGGGTPSILDEGLITNVMAFIRKTFKLEKDAEITIEANPGTLRHQKLTGYKSAGINRISIGLQSADDEMLNKLGRLHNYDQFVASFKAARRAGFDNINVDCILGLPGQTRQVVENTVDYLDCLGVSHISAYSLIVERGTPLAKAIREKKVQLPDDDFTVDLYDTFVKCAKSRGFSRYEVSNFAREGCQSKHNLNCWRYKEYLGVGVNSQSFMFGKRFSNVRGLQKYIEKIESGKSPVSTSKRLCADEQIFEFIMLGLRLSQGIDLKDFQNRFKVDFFEKFGHIIERLKKNDLVDFDTQFFKVKPDKFYILNSIITEFII